MESRFLKKILDILTNRMNILGVIFFLICVVFALKLFQLQIISGGEYLASEKHQDYSDQVIVPARGNILDRNGIPIATGAQTFTLQYLSTGLKADDLNSML